MKTLTFDIETNAGDFADLSGFDRVHCMSYCVDNHKESVKRVVGTEEVLKIWRKILQFSKKEKVVVVGHNIVSFDLPALYEIFLGHLGFPSDPEIPTEDTRFLEDFRQTFLLPQKKSNVTIMDTVLLCKLGFPDLYAMSEKDPRFKKLPPKSWGSHSLKNWGKRIGVHKGSFGETTDWENYTESMGQYCDLDVVVTEEILQFLKTDRRTGWLFTSEGQEVVLRETRFAQLIRQQELRGVTFDEEAARKLQEKIHEELQVLEGQLAEVFPPEVIETKTPEYWEVILKGTNKIFQAETKSACEAIRKKRGWKPKECTYRKGPMKTKTLPFNPGSRQQIVQRLQEKYGWEPEEFTDPSPSYPEGQPKVDGDVLGSLEYPEAKLLERYMDLQKIYGYLIQGDGAWVNFVKNGRIHGKVNTLGANTSRCTHAGPNMAQVPSARKPYGEECRRLFKATEGMRFVGCDASGLELRTFAGYLAHFDKGRYSKIVCEGDVHTSNQETAGLSTRDQAKTLAYLILYGGGAAKLAKSIGISEDRARRVITKFKKGLVGYERLQETIQRAYQARGYLLGLDRRRMYPRSEHSALNLILQGAGAIIMKESLIQMYFLMNDKNIHLGEHYDFLLNIHDEFQAEVLPEYVPQFLEAGPEAIRLAGEVLGLRCKLDGESKEGSSWAETH
jgi:DNA polymerase I-like protein with 3'-5' exonuclease and polymerase domains